jgi:hypothetical protein
MWDIHKLDVKQLTGANHVRGSISSLQQSRSKPKHHKLDLKVSARTKHVPGSRSSLQQSRSEPKLELMAIQSGTEEGLF